MEEQNSRMTGIERRDFIKTATAGLVAGVLGKSEIATGASPVVKKIIGIQVGGVSFLDEGVEQVLDIFEQRAHVNALYLGGFNYSRGLGGRQIPGSPLPDHGKLEYDLNWHGGNFATVHPQYYRDTGVDPKDLRAPDYGDWDFFAEVIPPAKKRGMEVVTWIDDNWHDDIPNIEKLQAVDLHGRKVARRLCHNNPCYQNLMKGIIADYINSYPQLDGIMYGSEQQGAFTNALGMVPGGKRWDPGRVHCFCQYCEAKAKTLGINFDRVKTAFGELEKFVKVARARLRPVDGYYVTLWRLLLYYPELLAWENFFQVSLHELHQMMHDQVKAINSKVGFGLHVWHNISFNPICRAEQDMSKFTQYTDFLKIVIYHNAAGPRMASYIDSVSETVWGDVPKDELLEFHYRILDYDEVPFDKVRQAGLKNDYVYRESQRAIRGRGQAKTLILPGIDIGIHSLPGDAESSREDVKKAVTQAFAAGAEGIVISRKYSEMRLDWLSGVGDALKSLRLV